MEHVHVVSRIYMYTVTVLDDLHIVSGIVT